MQVCYSLLLLGLMSSATAQTGWCKDTNRWCRQLALQGECLYSQPFMVMHCSDSCGFCVDAKCVDSTKLCPLWASVGGCKSSNRMVATNCPASCGACVPAPTRVPTHKNHERPGSQGQPGFRREPSPLPQPNIPRPPHRQANHPSDPNGHRQASPSGQLFPSPGFGGSSRLPSIAKPSFKCGLPYVTGVGRRTRQVTGSEPPKASSAQGGIESFADTGATQEGAVSCGATVISDRYLVTAAHCVVDNPPYSVRLGDLDLSQDDEANSRAADYEVEIIIVHPDYQFGGYNDLALIKTRRKIDFNEAVYPFCISNSRPSFQSTVTGAGFGYVNTTSTATHLQEVEMNIVDAGECERMFLRDHSESLRRWYPGLLRGSDIMCAGAPGKSACKGDAGGPLFQTDGSGKRYLVGIISRGLPCGDINNNTMPNFFISIADHVNFINSVIYEQI